jgi:hypothetical protein
MYRLPDWAKRVIEVIVILIGVYIELKVVK